MKNATIIKITGAQMEEMGWNIGDCSTEDSFDLWIDIETQCIKISHDVDGADFLSDFSFNYEESLIDLSNNDFLPRGIMIGNSLYVNDFSTQTTDNVQHAEIAEICDMSAYEIAALESLDQLNQIISGFSVTVDPEFEITEQ